MRVRRSRGTSRFRRARAASNERLLPPLVLSLLLVYLASGTTPDTNIARNGIVFSPLGKAHITTTSYSWVINVDIATITRTLARIMKQITSSQEEIYKPIVVKKGNTTESVSSRLVNPYSDLLFDVLERLAVRTAAKSELLSDFLLSVMQQESPPREKRSTLAQLDSNELLEKESSLSVISWIHHLFNSASTGDIRRVIKNINILHTNQRDLADVLNSVVNVQNLTFDKLAGCDRELSRMSAELDEVDTNILSLVKAGKSHDLLLESLYRLSTIQAASATVFDAVSRIIGLLHDVKSSKVSPYLIRPTLLLRYLTNMPPKHKLKLPFPVDSQHIGE